MTRIRDLRFNVLLVVLVAQTLGLAMNPELMGWLGLNVLGSASMAWLASDITRNRRLGLVLLAVGLTPVALDLAVPWSMAPLALNAVKATLYTSFYIILARGLFGVVYDADDITSEELAGAVAIYVLVGVAFADVFELVGLYLPGSVDFGLAGTGVANYADYLYFSFVTLSTVGYGDVAPTHPLTRVLAVAEAIIGLMYLAILVARLVSLHRRGRPAG